MGHLAKEQFQICTIDVSFSVFFFFFLNIELMKNNRIVSFRSYVVIKSKVSCFYLSIEITSKVLMESTEKNSVSFFVPYVISVDSLINTISSGINTV